MDSIYNQAWHQQQSYSNLQLEQEVEYNAFPPGPADSQGHRQNRVVPQHLASRMFQYQNRTQQPQQQQPAPTTSFQPQPQSLNGGFNFTSQQRLPAEVHSRSSSYGTPAPSNHSQGLGPYETLTSNVNAVQPSTNGTSYQPSPPFTYQSNVSNGAAGGSTTTINDSYLTTSPKPLNQAFTGIASTSQPYYRPQDSNTQASAQKRRAIDPAYQEDAGEDYEDEEPASAGRDAKNSKLARACGRCKNLKVKCEAKTETDPCRRCLNGGYPCVTPDRKIRRVPPKREHLLSQIASQAKEIESLMRQLEKLTAESSSNTRPKPERVNTASSGVPSSPVLSPSTTGSYQQPPSNTDDDGSARTKVIEAWLAKARESFQEFGSFIGVGGAGVAKEYVVGEDPEDNFSSDDDYVDVPEEFENGSELGIEVHEPSGERINPDMSGNHQLNHKSSGSSLGTAATTSLSRRRYAHEEKRVDLPAAAAPFGFLASFREPPRSRSPSTEPEEDEGPGIANQYFFSSTPAPAALNKRLTSTQHLPAILMRGIITPEIATQLFKIYFDNMNLSVSLLDPVLYTTERTIYRSPFLFTVICAIASRFYVEQPDLYPQLMHQAQIAAGTALISGIKNVEMCQAYILLSLYPVPVKKWEDQRGWLYLGLAIRTATDLSLHLPTTAKPVNENHAREMLNRNRVWLNCLNLDRSTGSQYGKPPIINPRDFIARHSENWWKSSPWNLEHFDIHICAYNAELGVMSAFIAELYSDPEHPTGLNKSVDFEGIAAATDDKLQALGRQWFSLLEQTDQTNPQNCFRTGLLRVAYSYARLVALSYGFQNSFGKSEDQEENPYLMRCLAAARDVVNAVVNDVCRPGQIHFWRHGPEAQSVFVTFASAFLVKLLQPKFMRYLNFETRSEIRSLVESVVNLLASPEVAIDDKHGPKLYSRFLAKLLSRPMAQLHPVSPAPSSYAPLPKQRQRTPPSAQSAQQNAKLSGSTAPSGLGPAPIPAFDIPQTVYNHSSPTTTGSLSPPSNPQALSFDHFTPASAMDPYGATGMYPLGGNADVNMDTSFSDYLNPTLPLDVDLMRSMQNFADPSGWQGLDMPVGLSWMTQFQQNFALDLQNPRTYDDQNTAFLTNPASSMQGQQ